TRPQIEHGVAKGKAKTLLDSRPAKFRPQRVVDLVSHRLNGCRHPQAGAQAARHQVDGLRELLGDMPEPPLPLLAKKYVGSSAQRQPRGPTKQSRSDPPLPEYGSE